MAGLDFPLVADGYSLTIENELTVSCNRFSRYPLSLAFCETALATLLQPETEECIRMKPVDLDHDSLELDPEETNVWQRELEYWRLFCEGDPACFQMVAEEFLGWPHTAERPQSKAALAGTLAMYRNKPLVPTLQPVGLSVAGDVAVVHLLRTVSGPGLPPTSEQVPLRVLHTWVRRSGEWYLFGGMGQQPGKS